MSSRSSEACSELLYSVYLCVYLTSTCAFPVDTYVSGRHKLELDPDLIGGHSVERIRLPRHIEIGPVSIPASSRRVQVKYMYVSNIDRCTSTAADMREAYQSQGWSAGFSYE